MSEYEHAVFISYAWGDERESVVNEIEKTLQQRGVKIVRDKSTLGYKGSIKEFMERIGQGNCVIVVISDKYLRSANCMFELVEIAENKEFHDRVFPIVLGDANIYDPIKRIEYVKYWEAKRAELARAMRKLDPANLQGIRDDMDQYDRIRDEISSITSILKDMNTLTPEMHRDSEFSHLYSAIAKRMQVTAQESSGELGGAAQKSNGKSVTGGASSQSAPVSKGLMIGIAAVVALAVFVFIGFRIIANSRSAAEVSTGEAPSTEAAVNLVTGFTVNKVYYDGGELVQVDAQSWVERSPASEFSFVEQSRDEWSVYLYDASRNISLQIDMYNLQVFFDANDGAGSQFLSAIINAEGK